MAYSDDQLNRIFDRTNGYCHLCHGKLFFTNYGRHGVRGAWHVEHSRPRAKGGSSHGNNLYAACIPCNLAKGTCHTRTARRWNGQTRAPYSKAKLKAKREESTWAGALLGMGIGAALGPWGAVLGGVLGAAIGEDSAPRR
jgi:hypothetical protein